MSLRKGVLSPEQEQGLIMARIQHLTPTSILKCLADETRVRIALLVAREGELCVCELIAALEESQPKISRHLAQLRSCGLLQDRRQGQWVYYSLHTSLPDWAHTLLQTILDGNRNWLKPCLQRLEKMRDRPGGQSVCG